MYTEANNTSPRERARASRGRKVPRAARREKAAGYTLAIYI